jgi:hypothetical protein
MLRGLSSAALAGVLAFAAGCGPIQSGSLVVEAQAELAAAQTAGAEKHAPFEYVAAEEYLHKAREEQSYSDFEISTSFARKARDCARAAKQIAESATRATMSLQGGGTKTSRCRPGPERMRPMLDANEEAAARTATPEPRPPAKKKVAPPPPSAEQPASGKKARVVKPGDDDKKKKKLEEPLPEGDDEE